MTDALCVAGDEMIADSYEMKEVEDNFFFEVEGSVSRCLAARLCFADW